MKNFIKESLQEFDHVVWPTKAETRKYFTIVVSMITVCALVLFVFGSAVTNALFAVRGVVAPERVYTPTDSSNEAADKILENLKKRAAANSGATNTGSTASGTVNPN